MAKSFQQIQEENARMENAANKGVAIGTGIMLFFWLVVPVTILIIAMLMP